ncbi:MAG TPA: DUF4910 domain-containing protein [Acidilobales archaeon]|nr:DUF4910 domain-containing protein [Acidilobales archaeon]
MNVSTALRKTFSIRRLVGFVADLSSYHRIQGSKDIEEAAKYIAETLGNYGVNVRLYEFNYGEGRGFIPPLIGWWVKDAELILKKPRRKILHNFNEATTLVVAHSPGGVFEGEVVHIGPGDDPKTYEGVDLEGKVILAYGRPLVTYFEVVKRGAKALLLYRRSGGPDGAIPYFSLFPTPQEVNQLKIPALSVSRRVANELIRYLEEGEEVVVYGYVKAGFRDVAKLRVVEASFGDGLREVHLIAHYCHPGGTVNDNVSGAAGLMELAIAFNDAGTKYGIKKPKDSSIRFIWVPEYYGTLPYLRTKLNEGATIEVAINLDMIGEKQEVTGSVLTLIKPLLKHFTYAEPLLIKELIKELPTAETFSSTKRVVLIRFDTIPYELGSDHDIYLNLGIPALMINQWPDKYYHTSADTIDKFDPEITRDICVAVGTVAYQIATREHLKEPLRRYVRSYLIKSLSESLMDVAHDDEVYSSRLNYLCRYVLKDELVKELGLQDFKNMICKDVKPVTYEGARYKIAKDGTLPSSILYRQLGFKEYHKLKKLLDKERWYTTVFQGILPTLLKAPKTADELYNDLMAEAGVKLDREVFNKVLSKFINSGIVVKVD